MSKLTKKDEYLLIGLAGVLFLVIAWFLIASPLQEKTATVKTENVELKSKAELYQAVNAQLSTYEKGIEDYETKKTDIINKYPSQITKEDEMMFWVNMENNLYNQMAVTTLNFTELTEVLPVADETAQTDTTTTDTTATDTTTTEATTEAATEAATDAAADGTATTTDATATALDVHLFKAPINYSFQATYDGLKNMMYYLLNDSNRKNIENINITFDTETGNLTGSMDVNLFMMTGTGREYRPLSIPATSKGVSDIFHTAEGTNGLNAAEQETTENAEDSEE